MKKTNLAISSLVMLAMFLSGCSSNSQTVREVSTKQLDVYEGGAKACSLDCYYLDDIGAPYIKLADLENYRMDTQFAKGFPIPDYDYSYSKGVMTAKQTYNEQTYTIEFDAYRDEIRSEKFSEALDLFHIGTPLDFVAADYSPIINPIVNDDTKTNHSVTLSLKEYGIDLYAYENSVLISFNIANCLFFNSGEKTFTYNGRALFESNEKSSTSPSYSIYNSYTNDEKNVTRNENTALYNRNEMMFLLNTFFGRSDESTIHDFRDYAKYLGIYDALASTTPSEAFLALRKLIMTIDDLHSGSGQPSPAVGTLYGDDEKDQELTKAVNSTAVNFGYRMTNFIKMNFDLSELRNKTIEKKDINNYSYYDDNMIIRFDGFTRASNSSVFLGDGKLGDVSYSTNSFNLFYDAFKDLKANHPEVKNIILDESINGGGDCTTLIELAGFFMKEVNFSSQNTVTGKVTNHTYKVDTNLDGTYDDNDFQANGYNVYVLISPVSFSCGNLLPMVMKNNKAASIIGTTSGGGCCIVLPMVTSQGDFFQISGNQKLGTYVDGVFNSNDNGIHPDIYVGPDDFYDLSKLVSYLK